MSSQQTPAQTIHFEDHDQDFLQWDLDAHGKVIGCRPFQASIWCEHTVKNHAKLKVGAFVNTYVHDDDGKTVHAYTIKYPIIKITKGEVQP